MESFSLVRPRPHWRRGIEELEREEVQTLITTMCPEVDALLQGGIRPQTLTEIVGLPGVGKTTLALQLCLNVQTPRSLKGSEGSAVYVGTNHSFMKVRLHQMTQEFVKRCNQIIIQNKIPEQPTLKVDQVMSSITVVRCCSLDKLSRLLLSMEKFLVQKGGSIKLLVVDGLDFPMFPEDESFSSRAQVLYCLAQLLHDYASRFDLAVVVTNCMTTRVSNLPLDDECNLFTTATQIPYLGEAWTYLPSQTLKLTVDSKDSKRRAELVKSSFCPVGSAPYRITQKGFRA